MNEISQFDVYPMTQTDKLLDWLGMACFFTTLEKVRATGRFPCLQSPRKNKLLHSVQIAEIFHTSSLQGGPTTSQYLMDQVLCPHAPYAAAFLDDVIINSDTRTEHTLWVAYDPGGSWPTRRSVQLNGGSYSIWGTT